MKNGNPGLKWDGTISAGSIIAAFAIVVPLIGVGYVSVNRIDDIQRTMDMQGDRFDMRISGVEQQVGLIREDLARRESLAAEVKRLADKVDKIEDRIK